MFRLGKKAKDDNSNPFTGYVADGLTAVDFKAEAEADTATQSEPAPVNEPVAVNVPAPTSTPISTTMPISAQPVATPAPVQQTPPVVQAPVRVEPVNPTTAQVDLAIKEAEAETELPVEDLLEGGVEPLKINIPEQEIVTERLEQVVTKVPAPITVSTPATSQSIKTPESAGQVVPILSTDEERATIVAAHKELAELLGWAERDTNAYMNEIQLVIDDLNSKIDRLRTSFAQDTTRLDQDAKIAFKENIEKNITLLKDQVNREQAKKDVLKSQKEEFIDKIHDALKKYRDSKR
jgi:hypothetical protein